MGHLHVRRLAQFVALAALIMALLSTLHHLSALRRSRAAGDGGDRHEPAEKTETLHSDRTLMIDDTVARALGRRARVLCWVPSTPKQLGAKVKAVNETWARRCDGHLFFVEGGEKEAGGWGPHNPPPADVVSLDVPPGYYNLTTKVVTILAYLYRFHLHDYDWFLKGDDDAYVVMENLRFLLSHYNPQDPVYVGHLYKWHHPQGYMSGGATYVLSREALKRVVEEGYKKKKCATKGRFEDLEVGKCLHAVGVASFNSRDRFGRDTFHPLRASTHIVGPIPANQAPQDYFTMVSGKDCCSQLTVSFHKVDPSLMRVVDHLLYRTNVYGRVPDLPALQGLVKPGTLRPLT